jgi:hypothetical protein
MPGGARNEVQPEQRAIDAQVAMLLTPELCRAARALLNWDRHQHAQAAEWNLETIDRFEAGGVVPLGSVETMLEALQGAGLEFIPAGEKSMGGGPGLRTRPVAEPEVAAAEAAVELDETGLTSSVTSSFDPADRNQGSQELARKVARQSPARAALGAAPRVARDGSTPPAMLGGERKLARG